MDWMPYRPILEILVTKIYTNDPVSQDSHPGGGSPREPYASSTVLAGNRCKGQTPIKCPLESSSAKIPLRYFYRCWTKYL